MLRNHKKFFLLLLLGFFWRDSVAESAKLEKYRWVPRKWQPLNLYFPLKLNGVSRPINIGLIRNDAKFFRAGNELVAKSTQDVEGAKVEGTWQKTVYSSSGEAIYSSGVVAESLPQELAAQVTLMRANRNEALEILRRRTANFQSASRVFGPWEEIIWHLGVPQPVWIVEWVSENEGQVLRARILATGAVLDVRPRGADFSDGLGSAYTKGPKESSLADVILPALIGDGRLNGQRANVSSALNIDVYQPNLIFQFGANDNRFDLVQAYFYLNRALDWFQRETATSLSWPLEARLHIGDNAGRNNRAYYYQRKVYLGAGDATTYKNLIHDPSIVFHETAHAIIDDIAGLASEGESGSFNEGFADLFAALMLDNPNMGEASYLPAPFRRTLNNQLKAYEDFKPGVYTNGTIIGGTFWDIRRQIGIVRTAQLAMRVLSRLGQEAKFSDFVPAMVSAMVGFCTEAEQNIVLKTLVNRGWRAMPNDFQN